MELGGMGMNNSFLVVPALVWRSGDGGDVVGEVLVPESGRGAAEFPLECLC